MAIRLPNNKHDLEAIEAIAHLPSDQLEPFLPSLLEWLQDFNWPVAKALIPVLSRCGSEIVAPIKAVLRSEDDVWKYWILAEFVMHLDEEVRDELMDEVGRIIQTPTEGERKEEVVDVAKEVMLLHGGKEP